MRGISVGPCGHGAVLETIAAAYDGLKRRRRAVGGLEFGEGSDGVGDDCAARGTKTVVV